MTIIEASWITLSVLGSLVSAVNLFDAISDRRIAKGQPDLEHITRTAARGEALRLVTMVSFAAAGLMAGFWPPGSLRDLVIGALMLGNAAMLINSILDRFDRHALIHSDSDRHAIRDAGRDEGRDPLRDQHRDEAHDRELDEAAESKEADT